MPKQIDVNFDEILSHIPPVIGEAIQKHGFAKLAQEMYGLPDTSERTLFTAIGEKLAARRTERREIVTGIRALADLGKE